MGNRRLVGIALGVISWSCGSAGPSPPVEVPTIISLPPPVLELDASAPAVRVATPAEPSAGAGEDAGASPVASSVPDSAPPRSPAPPPVPLDVACQGAMLDPRCFAAFPARVECPAKFSDVPKNAYCGLEGTTKVPPRCTYPEGVCRCEHVPYCGGVAPSQLQMMGMKWTCGPPRGPDDCPGRASDGAACRKNGQVCGYGGCGTSTSCTCQNGRYKCSTQHWAPPP
jgi:hypothetical protein